MNIGSSNLSEFSYEELEALESLADSSIDYGFMQEDEGIEEIKYQEDKCDEMDIAELLN